MYWFLLNDRMHREWGWGCGKNEQSDWPPNYVGANLRRYWTDAIWGTSYEVWNDCTPDKSGCHLPRIASFFEPHSSPECLQKAASRRGWRRSYYVINAVTSRLTSRDRGQHVFRVCLMLWHGDWTKYRQYFIELHLQSRILSKQKLVTYSLTF